MNKICWSVDDNCFFYLSDDYPDIIGTGDTPDEAKRIYNELLEDYSDYEAGRYGKAK